MRKLCFFLFTILLSCSSTELVENWKNPEIVLFDANKVLLVGMTHNESARKEFESMLKSEFDARDKEAFRSIDIFDINFTGTKRTEQELDDIEQSLLDKGFDAILLTKVVGSESRQSFRKTMNQLYTNGEGFSEDYRRHQGIYFEDDYYEKYTVYNAETSLYCICEGKERSLIWRGSINIIDPQNIEETIDDYVGLVVLAMEEQDLIFRHHGEDTDASL